MSSGGVAYAAPANDQGCTSVNAGAFHATLGHTQQQISAPVSGFSTGDVLTFVLTGVAIDSLAASQWWITDSNSTLLTSHNFTTGTATKTYTVDGVEDATITQTARVQNTVAPGQSITMTASCVPAPPPPAPPPPAPAPAPLPPPGPTNSETVSAIQVQGSRQAASISGAAISESVFGAIGGAFEPGGSQVTLGLSGVNLNFYVDPAASRTSALGAIDQAGAAGEAPSSELVHLWANIRASGIVRINPAAADLSGTQVNGTAGIGYKLLPDLTVGVFAGYEAFGYDFRSLSGRLDGRGGTVGTYAGWMLAPGLRWDALAGWSGLSYDAASGGASGSFAGSRIVASTALSGQHQLGDFTIEPIINAQAIWEHLQGWTDSLSGVHAARDSASGRISAGGRILGPSSDLATLTITPFVGFYGDWHFAGTDALPGGLADIGLAKGWSGRVTGGFDLVSSGAGSLGVSGEYGGLGSDYGRWTANVRAGWGF